jgi:hypothetical protein
LLSPSKRTKVQFRDLFRTYPALVIAYSAEFFPDFSLIPVNGYK